MNEPLDTLSDPPEPPEMAEEQPEARPPAFFSIRFRPEATVHTAMSRLDDLTPGEVVMVESDHGPEPARIVGRAARWSGEGCMKRNAPCAIVRRASRDEVAKYDKLAEMEGQTFEVCKRHIDKLGLSMHLVRVERYFNGGKVIFYFTAESRVDFRELVKALVQEFRTRVEMRQIGVRHETKMIGGLGCCGRELCCASFIGNFESVSIKMAKEQNLPLNPAKISGACNRLLCCLNYEFKTYKDLRKGMPKVGKRLTVKGQSCKVRRHNVLKETISVATPAGEEIVLTKEEWQAAKLVTAKE